MLDAHTDDSIEKMQCSNTAVEGDTVSQLVAGIDIQAVSTGVDNAACDPGYSDDDQVSLGDADWPFVPMEVVSVPG
jgi:hypothetical protein